MTGPLLEHIWATGFFAIEGFGPALAKAAGYTDVQELQSKAPGLYMRMLTRVDNLLTCPSVTERTLTPRTCLSELLHSQSVCRP